MGKNQIIKVFKDYFQFTNSEFKGVLFLASLILLFALLPMCLGLYKVSQLELEELESTEDSTTIKSYDQLEIDEVDKFEKKEVKQEVITYYNFDPNTVTKEELIQFGIKEKTAQTWIKFVQSGARFFKPEDILKVYGISEAEFGKLQPYISIVQEVKKEVVKPTKPVKGDILQIELNQADSATLVKLNGIGPVFAARIIKYRNLLGGFHSLNQLEEVYGLEKETINKISNNLIIDNTQLKKKNIGLAKSTYDLYHPYINKEEAQKIIDNLDKINQLNDLKILKIFSADKWNKLEPYLLIMKLVPVQEEIDTIKRE